MITRQRTQQPLERAVAKAMARRAELRAERDAQTAASQADTTSFDPQAQTTAALLKETALTTERMAAIGALPPPSLHPSTPAERANAPEAGAQSPLSGDTESEEFGTEEPSRPALPPAAMGLIERLANRKLDDPIDEELEAGLSTLNFTTLSEPVPSEPASAPAVPLTPEPEPEPTPAATSTATSATTSSGLAEASAESASESPAGAPDEEPAETASRSTSVDAFQLLLSNNPDADDNTRSDLRSAPSLRNPRKILNSTEPAAEPNNADAKKDSEAGSDGQDNEPSDRSLRNWFSPQQDPNPPPPPEHDPSRD